MKQIVWIISLAIGIGISAIGCSGGNQEFDHLLKEFDSTMAEMTPILQKAASGDMNAVMELQSFSGKLLDLSNRMNELDPNSLSKEQAEELLKVGEKYQEAMMKMMGGY
jgi:hypothetical protein